MVDLNRKIMFDGLRKVAHRGFTQDQVIALSAIFDALEKYEIPDAHVAYILATAYHETKFRNVRETFASSDAQAARNLSRIYRGRRKHKYWLKDAHTGQRYFGRGSIAQLTWKYNYEKMSKIFGIDFVNNPSLALDPKWAAHIGIYGMVHGVFTGKKLSDYRSFRGMRRVVNGTDKAKLFAATARRILPTVVKARDEGVAPPPAAVETTPEPARVWIEIDGVRTEYVPKRDMVSLIGTNWDEGVPQFKKEIEMDQAQGYAEKEMPMAPVTKSALASKTLWGALLMIATTVAPPLLIKLGLNDWAEAIQSQDYSAMLQLAAAALVVYGRQTAVRKLRWPKISF